MHLFQSTHSIHSHSYIHRDIEKCNCQAPLLPRRHVCESHRIVALAPYLQKFVRAMLIIPNFGEKLNAPAHYSLCVFASRCIWFIPRYRKMLVCFHDVLWTQYVSASQSSANSSRHKLLAGAAVSQNTVDYVNWVLDRKSALYCYIDSPCYGEKTEHGWEHLGIPWHSYLPVPFK